MTDSLAPPPSILLDDIQDTTQLIAEENVRTAPITATDLPQWRPTRDLEQSAVLWIQMCPWIGGGIWLWISLPAVAVRGIQLISMLNSINYVSDRCNQITTTTNESAISKNHRAREKQGDGDQHIVQSIMEMPETDDDSRSLINPTFPCPPEVGNDRRQEMNGRQQRDAEAAELSTGPTKTEEWSHI